MLLLLLSLLSPLLLLSLLLLRVRVAVVAVVVAAAVVAAAVAVAAALLPQLLPLLLRCSHIPQARVRARGREARRRDARRPRAEFEEGGSLEHAGGGGALPSNHAAVAGQASPRPRGRQFGNRVQNGCRACACFGEQAGPCPRPCAKLCAPPLGSLEI
jgi:hypothetical protein